MADYICIDGGTTNTRLTLVSQGAVQNRLSFAVGAGNGPEALKAAVQEGIPALLTQCNKSAAEISCILASGMITSECGLYELPHTPRPGGDQRAAPADEAGFPAGDLPHSLCFSARR